MKRTISFLSALLCVTAWLNAQKPVTLIDAASSGIRPLMDSGLEMKENSICVTSAGATAGIIFHGCRDLSAYKAIRCSVTNEDSVNVLHFFAEVLNPSCKRVTHSNDPLEGKAEYCEEVHPGQTKTIVFNLPAPMPHPEVNRIFYDNYIGARKRNTPYSYGYGLFCYDVDLKNIDRIGLGSRKIKKGVKFTISNVELVPGRQKKVPQWMHLDKEHFFPFIDKYGQFKYGSWPGKVKSDKDLQRARQAEEKDLAAHVCPQEWSKFGGWKNGPRQEATGHFYVKKIDGKWWMVDPEGYLFWSHGVVRVTPSSAVTPLDGHKFYFTDLPEDENDPFHQFYFTRDELLHPYYTARGIKETYDFSAANIYRKYGEGWREKWYDLAHRRLRSWGLNTIANSSDRAICLQDRTVYNDRVDLGSPVDGYPQWPIFTGSKGWWKFIDPFDPLFETCVRAHIEQRRKQLEDPWCLGFFVDNEIAWGSEAGYLASIAIKAPQEQASKRKLINFLMGKYRTIDDLNKAWESGFASWNALYENRKAAPKAAGKDLAEFGPKIVEKYFSTVRRVFKSIAPYKLYMGCRFASNPDYVVRIAAKYVDVISYNTYNFNHTQFSFPDGIDIPMMIGEFHFGAMDRGLFHTGQVYTSSQEQRARCIEDYVVSCLKNPYIVGTNWHQFSDQATSGRFDGENFQVGLTDVCDTPYPETIAALRRIGKDMYSIRSAK